MFDTLNFSGRRTSQPAALLTHLLSFCRLLRRAGLGVTPGRVQDAARSIQLISISNREDFAAALRANLVSRWGDLATFDFLFGLFWGSEEKTPWQQQPLRETVREAVPEVSETRKLPLIQEKWSDVGEKGKRGRPEEEATGEWQPAYSPQEVLATKDFSRLTQEEAMSWRQLMAQWSTKLTARLSRRRRADSRGSEIDLRRSLRRSLRYGGDPLELLRRRRRPRPLKLVLLCDVSGSMDVYGRFLVPFLYGVQRGWRSAETFVFGTRLTEVTRLLRDHAFEAALHQMGQRALDWSGGTSIGSCLHAYNVGPGRVRAGSRRVVVIISDGWDRGDATVLEREMKALKRASYKIIWLNPLLGNPAYQPLVVGMRAALPYVDHFLPAHNLKSLMALVHVLSLVR